MCHPRIKKRDGDPVDKSGPNKRGRGHDTTKKDVFGVIINKTGKPLVLPEGIKTKACKSFLDTEGYCRFKKACNFSHNFFLRNIRQKILYLLRNGLRRRMV